MKKTLEVNVNTKQYTQKEIDLLLDDSNTINLTSKISSKEAYKRRLARLDRKEWKEIIKGLILPIIALIVIFVTSFIWNNADAYEIPAEYKYYWVDNFQDYSREIRKEACYRTWKEILWEVTEEQVKDCATKLTLQVAYESGYMSSPRCVNDFNCVGMKWYKQDWTYWFLVFNSQYEWYLAYWEKFWKYHYKKSIRTLIFWYIQADWSYKYGWSGDDLYTKQRYINFIISKYNSVYRSL